MTKTKHESDLPCDCDVLERAVDEPDIPIIFDEKTNEFHLVYGAENSGAMILYYCSFCGGRLPESRRDRLFANVTDAEVRRIQTLTEKIEQLDDAIRILGEPDFDSAHGFQSRTADNGTEPVEINSYRSITYSNLSETANVRFTDYREHGVSLQITGKELKADT